MISFSVLANINRNLIAFVLLVIFCQQSLVPLDEPIDKTRKFTRQIEFDHEAWTNSAVFEKLKSSVTRFEKIISSRNQKFIVLRFIDLTRKKQDLENQIKLVYSDPTVLQPAEWSKPLTTRLAVVENELTLITPIVESILEDQTAKAISSVGLNTLGMDFPPVSFHTTPLPLALIISPREVIRQDGHISIESSLTLQQQIELEDAVADELNFSTLVEEVGGLGTYPTMVQQTSDLIWLLEVVCHEWIHNYLSFRPLGLNYDTNPDLRTINETTASIAGKELSRQVLVMFYPEFVPTEPDAALQDNQPAQENELEMEVEMDLFDFQKEMHETRITVDGLLADGKITEAEAYMEARRNIFWDNGYPIRKLNQAYFAFHGAYADTPSGAAGEDPIGEAVRELRSKSETLAGFVKTISGVSSVDKLQELISNSKTQ